MTRAPSQPVEGALPLTGVRVLDFGQYVAGPAAALLLADQGADVIHIDPPAGPMWTTPANAVLNRGKRAVSLDLRDARDVDVARRLAASADVVIENFRPGVMERFGLGPDALTSLNPRLVYLSLPGFSRREDRHDLEAWEGVIATAVGLYPDIGMNRRLRGLAPGYSPLPIASVCAAALGALAVSASLVARAKDGRGEVVEVPLASALLEDLVFKGMSIDKLPERYLSLAEREAVRRASSGESPNVSFEQMGNLRDPLYQNYRCKDGRLFYVCCVGHRDHPRTLLEALGMWETLRAEGLPTQDPYVSSRLWPTGTDCTILGFPLSQRWADRIRGLLTEVFLEKTSAEWEQFFMAHGVPGTAQRTCGEWMCTPHAVQSGLVITVQDPDLGRMKQGGAHVWLSGRSELYMSPSPLRPAAADGIPEWLPDVSSGAAASGSTPAASDESQIEGPALSGIRILDLSNVIAGPTIGAILARFGAEIIKVDPPQPTLDPGETIVYGFSAARGKRSILLDIRRSKGHRVVQRLVEWADAVVFNGVERQLRDLGLSLDALSEVNPQIVLCQLSAYGGPSRGPWAEHLGYEDVIEASTGIMARFGGSVDTPEEHAHVGMIDNLTGFLGAFAVVLGLIESSRTRGAVGVGTSLASAGQFLQAPFLFDMPGRLQFKEPSGPCAKGEHALYRLYEAADGWFFLGDWRHERCENLAAVPELAGIAATPNDASLAAYLAGQFRLKSADYWISRLTTAGVPAYLVQSMADVRSSHLIEAEDDDSRMWRDAIIYLRHSPPESGYAVTLAAPNAIRMKRRPTTVPDPAPKFGRDASSIIEELGFTSSEMEEMLDAGAVATAWSQQYLPD